MPEHAEATWALCIPTINRLDVLKMCVRCALGQTKPPIEISIADASEAWETNREAISRLIGNQPVRLFYEEATAKSSAVQRNQAASHVTADILFFFDDDALMHATCAEELMSVYAADPDRRISAAAGIHDHRIPTASDFSDVRPGSTPAEDTEAEPHVPVERKGFLTNNQVAFQRFMLGSGLMRFIQREIFMMSMNRMFVPYDEHRPHPDKGLPASLEGANVRSVHHLPGFSMTVRRDIFEREPFNPHLLAYCPTEDLDVSYRWGRYGMALICRNAKVHHYEVAASRVTRHQATLLGILNSAFFTRINSDAPVKHILHYYVLTIRRTFGEFLKDILTARLTFPQTRGAAFGLFRSIWIFRRSGDSLIEWYMGEQWRILKSKPS